MKTRIFSALTLTILLSACAAQRYMWDHPTANRAQFDADAAQCTYVAAMASGSYAPNNPGFRTAFGKAMADQMDINSRRGELAMLCMHSLGYTKRVIK